MNHYCTLFDSNYLTRGLAMYESLKLQTTAFHLYIFAFDDKAYKLLTKLNLEFVTVISLDQFEDEELLAIKPTRGAGEYCWTCTPSTIKYCIETFKLDECTYLDADLYFFGDPAILTEEMGDKSILLTEHRYTPAYDQSNTSGIYCVQFMTFKNTSDGMKALNWWRNACIDWCFARFEDGKFGDQKYLDDWTDRFEGVHVLQHLGGGVAPWNVQQYDLSSSQFKLIFYHFHNFKFITKDKVELGLYFLNKKNISLLYKPYVIHLQQISQMIQSLDRSGCYSGISGKIPFHWKEPIRVLKRKMKGIYNVYDTDFITKE